MRIRGTASQIYDKYCALAHDANASGDRIAAENYLQHAEHYYRIHNANGGANNRGQQKQQQQSKQQDQASQEIPGTGPQPKVEVAEEPAGEKKDEATVETKAEKAAEKDEVEETASAAD